MPRTKVQVGSATPNYRDELEISDALGNVLGFANLSKIALTYKDGSVATYTAWEYECDWCGQYGHTESNCAVKERAIEEIDEADIEAETEPDDFDSVDTCDHAIESNAEET